MSVTAATSVGAAAVSAATTGPNATLGQDAFLKLLVTEMRSQDPTHTMDDKEFIAQLAQFSSLEQTNSMATGLKNLATSNASAQAVGLIGKTIDFLDPSSSDTLQGKVGSVRLSSDGPVLVVGDKQVALGDVVS